MTFEKVSNNEMNIYVDIHNDDGTIDNVYQFSVMPILGLDIEF